MSWREKVTLGHEFVADVYDFLQVDPAFVLDDGDGFVYWAGDLATRIKTDMGLFRGSMAVYRVTAETDLVKGRGHLKELALSLEHEMDECSFSGPVYDASTDTFRMFCGVYASGDHAHWLRRTFASAVALQMAEAHEMSVNLSKRCHTSPAGSGHPRQGPRSVPDPMLEHVYGFYTGAGTQPSKWEGVPTWEQAGWIMEREARHFQTDRNSWLSATFDWMCGGDQGIDLSVRTDEPHQKLGNGLHVTLTVPMRLSPDAIGHLVLDLNTYEKTEYKRCHTLGSWCLHDGKLAFREFVPNALFDDEYLEETCVNMASRAIWANEWFYDMKCKAQASVTPSA